MTTPDLTLRLMYPSDYLRAEDLLGKPVAVTIATVNIAALPLEGGQSADRVVIGLRKTSKKFVCGKTNGYSLGVLISSRAAEWIGKRIILCPDVDTFGREDVPCIRIASSPDAAPDRAAAYARAWKGERRRGKLVGRLKRALLGLSDKTAAPVEPEDPEIEDAPATAPVLSDDLFAGDHMREPGDDA